MRGKIEDIVFNRCGQLAAVNKSSLRSEYKHGGRKRVEYAEEYMCLSMCVYVCDVRDYTDFASLYIEECRLPIGSIRINHQ